MKFHWFFFSLPTEEKQKKEEKKKLSFVNKSLKEVMGNNAHTQSGISKAHSLTGKKEPKSPSFT